MPTSTATVTIWALIDSSSFWSDFLAQLLATLIVVIIGSVIVPPIIRWNARAKMFLTSNTFPRTQNFKFVDYEKFSRTVLNLVVKNYSKHTIERFYWEMFIENDVIAEFVAKPPYPKSYTMHTSKGEKYTHIYGYIEMPIFPLDDIDFVFSIDLKIEKKKKVLIYYYFRTDYGECPKWAWIALWLGKYTWLKKLTIS